MDIVQKSNSNCDYFPPSSVSYRSYFVIIYEISVFVIYSASKAKMGGGGAVERILKTCRGKTENLCNIYTERRTKSAKNI
jgi:hypothetical protein